MANTLDLDRKGAVGFIDWLDGVLACKAGFDDLQCTFGNVVADLDAGARSTSDLVPVVRGRVWQKADPHALLARVLKRQQIWRTLGNPNFVVAEITIPRLPAFILPVLVSLKLA